jgi:hypothetical protein
MPESTSSEPLKILILLVILAVFAFVLKQKKEK